MFRITPKLFHFLLPLSMLVFLKPASAEYIQDYQFKERAKPLYPGLVLQGFWSVRYFVDRADHWPGLEAGLKLDETYRLELAIQGSIAGNGFSSDLNLKRFFNRRLHDLKREDYLFLGLGAAFLLDSFNDESQYSGLLRIGYGRNKLLWKNSPWGVSLNLNATILIPGQYTTLSENYLGFGLKGKSEAPMDAGIRVGVFRWWK